MEQRDKILEEYYAQMGIAKPVYDFCMKVEEELKDRFLRRSFCIVNDYVIQLFCDWS